MHRPRSISTNSVGKSGSLALPSVSHHFIGRGSIYIGKREVYKYFCPGSSRTEKTEARAPHDFYYA